MYSAVVDPTKDAIDCSVIKEQIAKDIKLIPVSKLPPEVLSDIFLALAIDDYARQRAISGSPSKIAYQWIVVTHVCRTWRRIALESTPLWSRIVLRFPTAAREFFSRSKEVPLWVDAILAHITVPQRQLFDTVLKESSRLKGLELYAPPDILSALSTGRADLLEVLTIGECSSSSREQRLSLPVIFQGHTPNLRDLRIFWIAIKWDNPLFCSTLTHLKIFSMKDITSTVSTFAQLIAALDQMSTLKSLELYNAIPRLTEDLRTLPGSLRTVNLPKLLHLSISSDAIDCANFLDHVSFPADARLIVKGRTEAGVEELSRAFCEYLARAAPLLAMSFSAQSAFPAQIMGWWTFIDGKPLPPPDVELHLTGMPRPLLRFFTSQPALFSSVRQLEVRCAPRLWDWGAFFECVENVHNLSIMGSYPLGLFNALLNGDRDSDDQDEDESEDEDKDEDDDDEDDDEDDSEYDSENEDDSGDEDEDEDKQHQHKTHKAEKEARGKVLLEKLHTVHLANMHFRLRDYYDEDLGDLGQVRKWLVRRAKGGMPIARLELRKCINLFGEDVERFTGVVDVDWDREEITKYNIPY